MLSSELHPDHETMAFVKTVLHEGQPEEQLKHLREVMSDNVIVSGWINDPSATGLSPEEMIAALKDRVDKFETNQHLREIQAESPDLEPTSH